jgi:hypothetical protein
MAFDISITLFTTDLANGWDCFSIFLIKYPKAQEHAEQHFDEKSS